MIYSKLSITLSREKKHVCFTLILFMNRTEHNIYFIDLNSTVSRHTYFDITKDSYKVTINVCCDVDVCVQCLFLVMP